MTSVDDLNGDGISDLVVHVSASALELSETDTVTFLEGQTANGTPIRGRDSVRVVPQGREERQKEKAVNSRSGKSLTANTPSRILKTWG